MLLHSVDLRSKILDPRPSFNIVYFHVVFRTFWPNNRLAPPFGVGAQQGNHGSATAAEAGDTLSSLLW